MESIPLRVCYFGTYRANYSRNQMMIAGLRLNGVEVIECHETLWKGIEDRVQTTSGGWLRPAFWWRVVRTYARLLRRYRRVGDYDVLIVGYPGQFDVFLARLLSWLRGRPMVWDIFMSIYLIALERNLDVRSRFTVNLLRFLECFALRLPDLLIQDTAQYVDWFHQTHSVPLKRFRLVPTGADDRIFQPVPRAPIVDNKFRAVYYGTFIPNHGVEHIVEAARLLVDEPDIHVEFIGRGPEQEKARRLAQDYGLKNVTFIEWLEKTELVKRVAHADVCLGAFGTTPQSLMTVQNKIYEGLAMAKPVISGDSPAVRQALKHGEHIYLCERENPQAIMEAINALRSNATLRHVLSENGYAVFKERYTPAKLGKLFEQYLIDLVQGEVSAK